VFYTNFPLTKHDVCLVAAINTESLTERVVHREYNIFNPLLVIDGQLFDTSNDSVRFKSLSVVLSSSLVRDSGGGLCNSPKQTCHPSQDALLS
jgi:hypothetical protein